MGATSRDKDVKRERRVFMVASDLCREPQDKWCGKWSFLQRFWNYMRTQNATD